MASIKQTFFQECEEQLAELESGLLTIEGGDDDPETVNAVFRAVHSIKGGAGAFGFDQLVEFVHVFETTLDLLRSNKLTATPSVTKTLLRASDILADLVRAAREGGSADEEAVKVIADELNALLGSAPRDSAEEAGSLEELNFEPVSITLDSIFELGGDAASTQDFIIQFKPTASLYAKANETIRLFRELGRLGEMRVECDASETPLLSELDPEGAYLSWTIRLNTDASESQVREVFEFVEWDCDLQVQVADVGRLLEQFQQALEPLDEPAAVPASEPKIEARPCEPPAAPASAEHQGAPANAAKHEAQKNEGGAPAATIRVDLDRVDRLINLVGELVIN